MSDKEFQVLDTTQIQLDSLLAVMDSIGYRVDRSGSDSRKPTGGFVTDNRALKANRNISLMTAAKIHNAARSEWEKVAEGWYILRIGGFSVVLSAYALNILYARKLVHKVKLQKNRKAPSHLVVVGHMVKVVNRSYTPLLGLE